MDDSIKTMIPAIKLGINALRLLLTHERLTLSSCTKPSTPPLRSISVITEPTIIAKARVLSTHTSLKSPVKRSKIRRSVSTGLKSAMINSPISTAVARAIKTERLKKARRIAISGGINPKRPYSMGNPYNII
jgi:hypothetical protein